MRRESNKEKSFRELFEQNYSVMYHAAMVIIKDADVAKDIIDDIFADLWDVYDETSDRYTPSYLVRSIRNRCIDYLKHEQVKSTFARVCIERYRSGALDEVSDDDRMERVLHLISEMPQRTQFVMEQCYLEDKKYDEVADLLGITKSGVKSHIMKGLDMLRNAFSVKYKKGKTNQNP